MKNLEAIPDKGAAHVDAADVQPEFKTQRKLATRDRDLIRQWAGRHRAEPATGEATVSGPATIDVKDGGAGIRFNFPAAARFRPISWEEWFDNFDRHRLIFVYDEDVADRAYELWQRRRRAGQRSAGLVRSGASARRHESPLTAVQSPVSARDDHGGMSSGSSSAPGCHSNRMS